MRVDLGEDPSVITTSCAILQNIANYLKNGSKFDECDNEGAC
jgi:hypothetical protein